MEVKGASPLNTRQYHYPTAFSTRQAGDTLSFLTVTSHRVAPSISRVLGDALAYSIYDPTLLSTVV
jgi:hypothetical protein